jgi:hypothetical protein
MINMGEVAEGLNYSPEYRLTDQELFKERNDVIAGFLDTFKEDPDVQQAVLRSYFSFDKEQGKKNDPRNIEFQKGEATYKLIIGAMDGSFEYFVLQRTVGNREEHLYLNGSSVSPFKFEVYERQDNVLRQVGETEKDSGAAVASARGLQAKTRQDFAKN